uniref:CSON010737 protein n=1 Tax=Culicoides sonorensis TaxID=179676 RepID=A0A336M2R3_CULSO
MIHKSINCDEYDNKIFLNVTCKLKVTKEVPTGLIYFGFFTKLVEKPFLRFTMFYRYTMGFRPYLFDIKIDLCQWINKTHEAMSNPAFERIFNGFLKSIPNLFVKCPFEGHYQSEWVDANNSFSPFLPPVVAAGRYKTIYHVYSSESPKILKGVTQFDIKPRKEFRVVGSIRSDP